MLVFLIQMACLVRVEIDVIDGQMPVQLKNYKTMNDNSVGRGRGVAHRDRLI
jgi:hypothetical protein